MNVFDIETGPQSDEILDALYGPIDPEKAIPDPGPFDPANESHFKPAKNWKPETVKEKEAEAKAKHETARHGLAQQRIEYVQKEAARRRDEACGSPLTGIVEAIGIDSDEHSQGNPILFAYGSDQAMLQDVAKKAGFQQVMYAPDEASMLAIFWAFWRDMPGSWVGHCIEGFDVPFLINRSRILHVDHPAEAVRFRGKWPEFSSKFIDTSHRWAFDARPKKGFGVADISKACGGPGKHEGDTGLDFYKNYRRGGEDRIRALKYLAGDLVMARVVAEAAGIV